MNIHLSWFVIPLHWIGSVDQATKIVRQSDGSIWLNRCSVMGWVILWKRSEANKMWKAIWKNERWLRASFSLSPHHLEAIALFLIPSNVSIKYLRQIVLFPLIDAINKLSSHTKRATTDSNAHFELEWTQHAQTSLDGSKYALFEIQTDKRITGLHTKLEAWTWFFCWFVLSPIQ